MAPRSKRQRAGHMNVARSDKVASRVHIRLRGKYCRSVCRLY